MPIYKNLTGLENYPLYLRLYKQGYVPGSQTLKGDYIYYFVDMSNRREITGEFNLYNNLKGNNILYLNSAVTELAKMKCKFAESIDKKFDDGIESNGIFRARCNYKNSNNSTQNGAIALTLNIF